MEELFLGTQKYIINLNRGSVSNQTLNMIRKWWDAYDGVIRDKHDTASVPHRIEKMGLSHYHVTWRNPEIVPYHGSVLPFKKTLNSTLPECNKNISEEYSSRIRSNKVELNPDELHHRRSQSQNDESKLTPYLAFEQRISTHAKRVEKNPPASLSSYKISWDSSRQ